MRHANRHHRRNASGAPTNTAPSQPHERTTNIYFFVTKAPDLAIYLYGEINFHPAEIPKEKPMSRNCIVVCVLLGIAFGLEPGAVSAAGALTATSNRFAEAASLMGAGKSREAAQIYDALIQESRVSRDIHKALYLKGMCLHALKQPRQALACWDELLKPDVVDPYQDDALLEMAKTYAFDLNQVEPALKLYERFFKTFPASKRLMEARYQECGVYYRQGKHAEAQARFERFLKDFPNSYLTAEAGKLLALCEKKLAAPPPAPKPTPKPTVVPRSSGSLDSTAELSQALAGAEELFRKGRYEDALAAYQKIRSNFPFSAKDELSFFRIGQCYVNMGQDDKAVAAWGEIVTKSRGKPESEYADDSLLALADLYLQTRGEPEKALEYCQTLIKTLPESELIPRAEHQAGLIYFYQGKPNEARAIFEKERALAPQDTNAPPDGLTRLLEACKGERRYVPDCQETARGRLADTQIRQGDVYFTAKEYAKAKTRYAQAVRLAPGTEEAAYALLQAGRCYNQLGQFKNALRSYEPFLKEYQNSGWADDALLRAGVIYVGPLRDGKSGAKLYRTILERYPKGNEADRALLNLALLSYWGRDFSKARDLFQRLLEEYPDSRYAPYVKTSYLMELETVMAKQKAKRGVKQ